MRSTAAIQGMVDAAVAAGFLILKPPTRAEREHGVAAIIAGTQARTGAVGLDQAGAIVRVGRRTGARSAGRFLEHSALLAPAYVGLVALALQAGGLGLGESAPAIAVVAVLALGTVAGGVCLVRSLSAPVVRRARALAPDEAARCRAALTHARQCSAAAVRARRASRHEPTSRLRHGLAIRRSAPQTHINAI